MAGSNQFDANKIEATSERKDHQVPGCDCLYLTVQPTGGRAWYYKWRRRGTKGAKDKIRLGSPQTMTQAKARLIGAQMNEARERGLDPRTVLQRNDDGDSFLRCCRDHVTRHVSQLRGRRETTRLLGLDPELNPVPGGLAKRWAERPVTSITEDELWQVIDHARGGIGGLGVKKKAQLSSRARKMHSALSVLFGWLKAQRRIKVNPMLGIEPPKPPAARRRVLSHSELKAFWAATDAVTPPFGDVFKLLALTAARLREVSELQWSELTDDGRSITLAGERTKNGEPFVIPLSPMARSIILRQPRSGGFVFTTTMGRRPVSGWSKIKRRLDLAMGDLPAWRLHDLRRTTATMLAEELNVRIEVVEAILNHLSGKGRGGIAGVYNLSEYREQKRQALDAWALHLALLTS
ncbi:integrase arm-type DNA-binding domain-containing protein [Bradyrhizobium sp. UFLA05-153]